jgi:hypothetical protein
MNLRYEAAKKSPRFHSTPAIPCAMEWMNFNPYNLLAGFIFGTLGWGAFSYGRKLDLWKPRAIGVGLMVYPYFIATSWLLWVTGVGLLVLLWFQHDQ